MSLADEIRAALKNASGPLTAEEIFAKCESAKTVDHISTNISAFVQRGEVQRQTVLGQRAGTFLLNPRYVKGQPETGTGAPRIIAGKSGMGGVAKAAKDQSTAAPSAEKKPRKKREPKPFKAAKRSKRAAPVPRVSKKAKKLIQKARRLAAPIDHAPPQAPAADPGPTAVFGIRDDGALGIDSEGHNVRLPRADVQRLQQFLETTSPLWS